jgi:transcriptional regulator with XRE-family HTH domain
MIFCGQTVILSLPIKKMATQAKEITAGQPSAFGERLKSLRMSKGMSQKAFAENVGVHPVHYNRYENGVTVPAAETLSKLAEGLGVSVDYLLEGKNEDAAVANFEDKELLGMFAEIEKMPAPVKAHVKFALDSIIRSQKVQQIA